MRRLLATGFAVAFIAAGYLAGPYLDSYVPQEITGNPVIMVSAVVVLTLALAALIVLPGTSRNLYDETFDIPWLPQITPTELASPSWLPVTPEKAQTPQAPHPVQSEEPAKV